jgi:hypothetical protein
MLNFRVRPNRLIPIACALGALMVASYAGARTRTTTSQASATRTVRVTITGGYATDPRDNGRPVRLVAGALGVPPDVFREAFSHVTPAPGGEEPDPDQVQ